MQVLEPQNSKDGRQAVIDTIIKRRGNPTFRNALLEAYDYRCAITSFNAPDALEATCIVPFRGKFTHHPSNGLLLRGDIHTLFDLGKIAIDTGTMSVVMTDDLMQTNYRILAGRPLRYPRRKLTVRAVRASTFTAASRASDRGPVYCWSCYSPPNSSLPGRDGQSPFSVCPVWGRQPSPTSCPSPPGSTTRATIGSAPSTWKSRFSTTSSGRPCRWISCAISCAAIQSTSPATSRCTTSAPYRRSWARLAHGSRRPAP